MLTISLQVVDIFTADIQYHNRAYLFPIQLFKELP